jgi:hypothetical protein
MHDMLEHIDHRIEDFADYAPEPCTCVDCDVPLDDDELILGARCRDCRSYFSPLTQEETATVRFRRRKVAVFVPLHRERVGISDGEVRLGLYPRRNLITTLALGGVGFNKSGPRDEPPRAAQTHRRTIP